MDRAKICTCLNIKKGFINVNSKNCINCNDRHKNRVNLIV